MRRLYAWAAVSWSIGWLFLPPNPGEYGNLFWLFAGFGTLLCLAAGWDQSFLQRWPTRAIIPAAILAIGGWWWSETIFAGALLIAAGVLVLALSGRFRWGIVLGDGLLTAGTIGLFQLVGHYIFMVYLGPRGHGAAIPSSALASMLQLLGVNASALADGLHLHAVDRLYQVVPSPNNMGMQVFWQLFTGLVALVVVGKIRPRRIVTGAFVIGVFALVRYAAVMFWDYHNGGLFSTYWLPDTIALTVWPVGFFLHGGFAQDAKLPPDPAPIRRASSSNKRLAAVVVLTAIGVFLWTAYESYHAPGTKKAGRMLIDELHSDWEWSEMPFDTLWYGQQSTYNFYCLAEFWGKHYQMERGYDSLTPELLKNYDILVLKVPTSPYAPEEIDAVYDWVEDGGGLILIGEHTNVFGYATFLNPVATRFGQRFISDIVYDLTTGDLNLHHIPKLLPHPVAQNMPTFLFGGPCSMYGDLSARSIITGLELKTLPADYTQRNFFPERTGHTGYRFGMFLLSMSTRCGKGRIVSFTDSTLWSNFFVFIPGKPELALALADYVNRYESFPWWRTLAFLGGLGCLLAAALAASGLRREGWAWIAAIGLATFTGSAGLIQSLNARNYPLPEPHTPVPQLNFESEHSQFFVPELRLARNEDKDLSTFYLWTQRVGIVPRKFATLEDALAQPGGQMILEPGKPFDDGELKALKTFVEEGGTLYILDDPTNRPSSSGPLMQQFGMSFDMSPGGDFGFLPGDVREVLWRGSGRVAGGEPFHVSPNGSVNGAIAKIGKGRVIAFANSHVFERKTMGYTAMIPNTVQNTISQFEYHLLSFLGYPAGESNQPKPAAPADTTGS